MNTPSGFFQIRFSMEQDRIFCCFYQGVHRSQELVGNLVHKFHNPFRRLATYTHVHYNSCIGVIIHLLRPAGHPMYHSDSSLCSNFLAAKLLESRCAKVKTPFVADYLNPFLPVRMPKDSGCVDGCHFSHVRGPEPDKCKMWLVILRDFPSNSELFGLLI